MLCGDWIAELSVVVSYMTLSTGWSITDLAMVTAAVESLPAGEVQCDVTEDNTYSGQLRPLTASSRRTLVEVIACHMNEINSLVKKYNLDKETAGW